MSFEWVSILEKLLLPCVLMMGTGVFLNKWQNRKTQGELIVLFSKALSDEDKHAVGAYFRLLYGLNMEYSEIVALTKHENSAQIIYCLKRTPRLLFFRNGFLQYSKVGRIRFFRSLDNWFWLINVTFWTLISFLILYLLAISPVNLWVYVYSSAMLAVCAVFLFVSIEEIKYNQDVEKIVIQKESKTQTKNV